MSDMKIENARIRSTMLGREDHGIMTAFLDLEGEGWGCGFGGYAMDAYDEATQRRVGRDFGMEFIARVLETVGVEKWEELPGKHIRCEMELGGSIKMELGGSIKRIGHITKNKWFDPKLLAEEMRAAR